MTTYYERIEDDGPEQDAMVSAAGVRVGQRVTTSGYPGTVTRICDWSRNADGNGNGEVMVEVRLASGTTCVSNRDLRSNEDR